MPALDTKFQSTDDDDSSSNCSQMSHELKNQVNSNLELEVRLHNKSNGTKLVDQSQFNKHFISNLARFIFDAKMNKPSQEKIKVAISNNDVTHSEQETTPSDLKTNDLKTSDLKKCKSTETEKFAQPRYVKVCTLFKPILRRFRSFLRTEFDQGRKISLYQHWSDQTYL